MEVRNKKKVLQVWGVCGLILCALLAGLWLAWANAAKLVRLSAREDSLTPKKPVLVCSLSNPTPRYVCYGADFRVERWNEGASAWETYDVSKVDINFDLGLRGVRPFLSEKYDLTKHPNYKYTADADKRNVFDIERYIRKQKVVVKPNDIFDVYELDLRE